jgi:hypothetical protein
MRYKVIFYPMYDETLVIESVQYDHLTSGVDYTHHYTLKTPRAATWSASSRLRELADRLEESQD